MAFDNDANVGFSSLSMDANRRFSALSNDEKLILKTLLIQRFKDDRLHDRSLLSDAEIRIAFEELLEQNPDEKGFRRVEFLLGYFYGCADKLVGMEDHTQMSAMANMAVPFMKRQVS